MFIKGNGAGRLGETFTIQIRRNGANQFNIHERRGETGEPLIPEH